MTANGNVKVANNYNSVKGKKRERNRKKREKAAMMGAQHMIGLLLTLPARPL